MDLDLITRAAALIAVLGTAVVYGTDVFCAIVLRPALASVDDRALVAVMGSVHRYGDRRMPVPGVLGIVAAAATAVLATVGRALGAGHRGGRRAGPAVGLARALRTGERTHQSTTDCGRRRRPGATERACAASEVGPNHRRPRDAARSGSGRPVRRADDLSSRRSHTPTSSEGEQHSMFQLRIYTLRSPEALQQYATVHWDRHLATFTTFGVTTHGVWTERSGGANRLVALIRYPPGADPEELTRQIMTSPEFAADMAGFDIDEIVDVQSVLLDPTSFSPIH